MAEADEVLPPVREIKTFGAVARVGSIKIIHTGQRQGGRHNPRYPWELSCNGVAIDEYSSYREAVREARRMMQEGIPT